MYKYFNKRSVNPYEFIINNKVDNNVVDNEKTTQFLWPRKSGNPRECLL